MNFPDLPNLRNLMAFTFLKINYEIKLRQEYG